MDWQTEEEIGFTFVEEEEPISVPEVKEIANNNNNNTIANEPANYKRPIVPVTNQSRSRTSFLANSRGSQTNVLQSENTENNNNPEPLANSNVIKDINVEQQNERNISQLPNNIQLNNIPVQKSPLSNSGPVNTNNIAQPLSSPKDEKKKKKTVKKKLTTLRKMLSSSGSKIEEEENEDDCEVSVPFQVVHECHVDFNELTGFSGLPNDWISLLQSSLIGVKKEEVISKQKEIISCLEFQEKFSKIDIEERIMPIKEDNITLMELVSSENPNGLFSNIHKIGEGAAGEVFIATNKITKKKLL